ncbi:MAG: class A beta-lactamase-related serine hydrolase [Chloroflexota bacterium]
MRLGRRGYGLRWISIGFFLVAVLLLTFQLISFSRSRNTYPDGLKIGGVPVGNLDRQQAADRILEVYSFPVEMYYGTNIIQLSPGLVGFDIDLESMLASGDAARIGGQFWEEYWNYLWRNQPLPEPVPLAATYSEQQLRNYLTNEVALRYDQFPTSAKPQIGTVNFDAGTSGTSINMDIAVLQIENALKSPSLRTVNLPLEQIDPGRPSFQNLRIFLQQAIDIADFDGLAGIYLLDLQSSQEIHFVTQGGIDVSVQPTDVSFTASSIIKIPIMVSAYRRLNEPPPVQAQTFLTGMIEESGNDPADWLMEQFIDPFRGPLEVTEDMRAIGLNNTFLAGHFRLGSPLLQKIDTPANSRTDVFTDPDLYNQTTLSDIGMLLADIYQCSQNGGGALAAVFPGEITQAECKEMVNLLTRNFVPFLIPAGAPEGTQVAHKHGWVSDLTGAIRTIGDAGIVFTPSGNYVLVIYFYHPTQLVWDPISTLISDLSRIIYNYYNTSS